MTQAAWVQTNGVALGVTPRVLTSVCPAVLVQWRRPRESPVPTEVEQGLGHQVESASQTSVVSYERRSTRQKL